MINEVRVNELLDGAKKAEGTAVIVDIFRATSTLAVMFGLGANAIYPAEKIDEARDIRRKLKRNLHDYVFLCGEVDGYTPSFFDSANSPNDFYSRVGERVRGKSVVATSTNGMRGIIAAEKAGEVIAASFLNIDAVVDYLSKKDPRLVTLVSMGEFGKRSDEDYLFSQHLKTRLLTGEKDSEQLRRDLKNCPIAQLMRQYFGVEVNRDINLCLRLPLYDGPRYNFSVVPKLRRNDRCLVDALKDDNQ